MKSCLRIVAERNHGDGVIAEMRGDQCLAGFAQTTVIVEHIVNLAIAELKNNHADDRAVSQQRRGDERGRLGHAGINFKIGDLRLQQRSRPVEDICQLAVLERPGRDVGPEIHAAFQLKQNLAGGRDDEKIIVAEGIRKLVPISRLLRRHGFVGRRIGTAFRERLGKLRRHIRERSHTRKLRDTVNAFQRERFDFVRLVRGDDQQSFPRGVFERVA